MGPLDADQASWSRTQLPNHIKPHLHLHPPTAARADVCRRHCLANHWTIQAVKWQGSNLGVPGSHRRSGYFYGSRQDSAGVWDVHWRGAIERETNIRMMHKQRSTSVPLGQAGGRPEAESHDVYLALHPSQVEFANMLSERLQANGYSVYSNLWLFRQNSTRSYKADTSAWEKSTKPWRSSQAQHLSPTRPTATGARQEELLLRQCRHSPSLPLLPPPYSPTPPHSSPPLFFLVCYCPCRNCRVYSAVRQRLSIPEAKLTANGRLT